MEGRVAGEGADTGGVVSRGGGGGVVAELQALRGDGG